MAGIPATFLPIYRIVFLRKRALTTVPLMCGRHGEFSTECPAGQGPGAGESLLFIFPLYAFHLVSPWFTFSLIAYTSARINFIDAASGVLPASFHRRAS